MLQTITWTGQAARLLDQTKLPTETVYVDITDERQMWDAIRRLVIRGAPAIGVAAAFGAYLGVRNFNGDRASFFARLDEVCTYLATSRPTAVNLFWALDRIKHLAHEVAGPESSASPPCHVVRDVQEAILDECLRMIEEDNATCRAIGEHGFKLLHELTQDPMGLSSPPLPPGEGRGEGMSEVGGRDTPTTQQDKSKLTILTHCNAGGLATVKYGTALAPIYVGTEHGQQFHVYADETRPLLQGSRITAYELQQNGIPCTVICDNMAATVMSEGKVNAIIVGTDRVAANGDVANKIGTHGVAILAKHFNIPFLVAAPTSSIDLSLASGDQIPIEQRDGKEISDGFGKTTAPSDVKLFNPAFDVTPAELVTAIITEHGVVRPPYTAGLKNVCRANQGSHANRKK